MRRFAMAWALALGVGAAWVVSGPAIHAAEYDPFSYTSHGDVSLAQGILQNLRFLAPGSYKSGEVDPPTIAALTAFQHDHHLRPTGRIDYDTMTQLLSHRPAQDSDGDGVPDARDKCPNTPQGAKVDERGCPLDSDGDGVADGIDRCPDTPRGARVDESGCPLDSDHDGVFDGLDKCPDTPRGAKVDERGCPHDADGDGVADGIDRCPDTPRGVKVDATGCPLDSDGDGVTDDRDKCPDTPHGTKVDATGCPLAEAPSPYIPEAKKSLVLEGVYFETNSAKLKPESTAVLDRVAAALREHPDVRIEVDGHTDNTGEKTHNDQLSRARANAVRDFLSGKGIGVTRLEAKGYGSSQPIADNKTAAGRAKNRRVELKRLD